MASPCPPGPEGVPARGAGEVIIILLTFRGTYQRIIISGNELNQELMRNIELGIFIYKWSNINCLAENDIRESLSLAIGMKIRYDVPIRDRKSPEHGWIAGHG
jgi:hypothetical protein